MERAEEGIEQRLTPSPTHFGYYEVSFTESALRAPRTNSTGTGSWSYCRGKVIENHAQNTTQAQIRTEQC
ncbi:hypothetical protein PoMZ_06884 [Pyricularia oryzae]|uniref:Uncharacterized protein n=1 Tax=Pyricularia oryzae TaxID=318829 RepID=A0A4V1C802_PYROR|nr:hypothetical protein PoMZ_06884 [Pyricularia oryzae]